MYELQKLNLEKKSEIADFLKFQGKFHWLPFKVNTAFYFQNHNAQIVQKKDVWAKFNCTPKEGEKPLIVDINGKNEEYFEISQMNGEAPQATFLSEENFEQMKKFYKMPENSDTSDFFQMLQSQNTQQNYYQNFLKQAKIADTPQFQESFDTMVLACMVGRSEIGGDFTFDFTLVDSLKTQENSLEKLAVLFDEIRKNSSELLRNLERNIRIAAQNVDENSEKNSDFTANSPIIYTDYNTLDNEVEVYVNLTEEIEAMQILGTKMFEQGDLRGASIGIETIMGLKSQQEGLYKALRDQNIKPEDIYYIREKIAGYTSILNLTESQKSACVKLEKLFDELGDVSPFSRRDNDVVERDETAVKVLELEDNFNGNENYEEIVGKIKSEKSKLPRLEVKNNYTDWNINIVRQSIEESYGYIDNKLREKDSEFIIAQAACLYNLPNLIENSVLLDSVVIDEHSKNSAKLSMFMHELYAPFKFRGKNYIAKLDIEHFENERYVSTDRTNKDTYLEEMKRLYNVRGIKIVPISPTLLGLPQLSGSSQVGDLGTDISIAHIFTLVKGFDEKFYKNFYDTTEDISLPENHRHSNGRKDRVGEIYEHAKFADVENSVDTEENHTEQTEKVIEDFAAEEKITAEESKSQLENYADRYVRKSAISSERRAEICAEFAAKYGFDECFVKGTKFNENGRIAKKGEKVEQRHYELFAVKNGQVQFKQELFFLKHGENFTENVLKKSLEEFENSEKRNYLVGNALTENMLTKGIEKLENTGNIEDFNQPKQEENIEKLLEKYQISAQSNTKFLLSDGEIVRPIDVVISMSGVSANGSFNMYEQNFENEQNAKMTIKLDFNEKNQAVVDRIFEEGKKACENWTAPDISSTFGKPDLVKGDIIELKERNSLSKWIVVGNNGYLKLENQDPAAIASAQMFIGNYKEKLDYIVIGHQEIEEKLSKSQAKKRGRKAQKTQSDQLSIFGSENLSSGISTTILENSTENLSSGISTTISENSAEKNIEKTKISEIFIVGNSYEMPDNTKQTVLEINEKSNSIIIKSENGWVCEAVNPEINDEGKIHWGYSKNGIFEENFLRDLEIKSIDEKNFSVIFGGESFTFPINKTAISSIKSALNIDDVRAILILDEGKKSCENFKNSVPKYTGSAVEYFRTYEDWQIRNCSYKEEYFDSNMSTKRSKNSGYYHEKYGRESPYRFGAIKTENGIDVKGKFHGTAESAIEKAVEVYENKDFYEQRMGILGAIHTESGIDIDGYVKAKSPQTALNKILQAFRNIDPENDSFDKKYPFGFSRDDIFGAKQKYEINDVRENSEERISSDLGGDEPGYYWRYKDENTDSYFRLNLERIEDSDEWYVDVGADYGFFGMDKQKVEDFFAKNGANLTKQEKIIKEEIDKDVEYITNLDNLQDKYNDTFKEIFADNSATSYKSFYSYQMWDVMYTKENGDNYDERHEIEKTFNWDVAVAKLDGELYFIARNTQGSREMPYTVIDKADISLDERKICKDDDGNFYAFVDVDGFLQKKSEEEKFNYTPKPLRNTIEHKNYSAFEKLFPQITSGEFNYMRLKSEGFEPVSVEYIGKNTISIMQFYTQNGDLMRDPDMTFKIDTENKTLTPLSFQNSALGIYQEVTEYGAGFQIDSTLLQKNIPNLQSQLNTFANEWLRNISEQNHKPELGNMIVDGEEKRVNFDENGEILIEKSTEKNELSSGINTTISENSASDLNDRLAEIFGLDKELLTTLYNSNLDERNINEYGKLDKLKITVDMDKAAKYFTDTMGEIKPYMVNVYLDKILRDYILTGEFEEKNIKKVGTNTTTTENSTEKNTEKGGTNTTISENSTEKNTEKGGTNTTISKKSTEKSNSTEQDENGLITANQGENFKITDENLGVGGAKEKFKRNIEAIKLLNVLENENRQATPDEQEILSKYVGWGGLSQAFDPDNSSWTSEYLQLKNLLTTADYENAAASTLNAHYTSPTIISAMYNALEKFGIPENAKILEPSCGTGNFFGMLPETFKNASLYGVELDNITAKIAAFLYPNAKIENNAFEKTNIKNNTFDCAVGNVPFSDYRPFDGDYKNQFYLHDHFFRKSLDKIASGGIIAFITTKGTLDKKTDDVRKYLAERAEFIGAIRLPNNAFKANAGTEVTSDIIFLKKREFPVDISTNTPSWVNTGFGENGVLYNQYFIENPQMILGKMENRSGRFGIESTCSPIDGADLKTQLNQAISYLSAEFSVTEKAENNEEKLQAPLNQRNWTICEIDGDFYLKENSELKKVPVAMKNIQRMRELLEVRKALRDVIDVQVANGSEELFKEKQQELNSVYDRFIAKNGYITDDINVKLFERDDDCFLLQSIEKKDSETKQIVKSDIFSKRTIRTEQEITQVDTPEEGLIVSLDKMGKVDVDFISQLCDKTKTEVIENLFENNLIFFDPYINIYVETSEYLSGNVREKLKFAEEKMKENPDFNRNVTALKAVIPQDISATDIALKISVNWISTEDYAKFLNEFAGGYLAADASALAYQRIAPNLRKTANNEYKIDNKNFDISVNATSTFGTEKMNMYQIFENLLNKRDCIVRKNKEDEHGNTVYDDKGNSVKVIDYEETQVVQAKAKILQENFANWFWSDTERREHYVRLYNDRFNNIVTRSYDGSHQNFIGMSPVIELQEHQKNAIARAKFGRNSLFAPTEPVPPALSVEKVLN